MNRTFKVAKSLTRGVVVTSEKASSYQGKAVKTVVAAAVASFVAGAAMAAEEPTTAPVAHPGVAIAMGADGVVGSLDAKYGTVSYNKTFNALTVNASGFKTVEGATGYGVLTNMYHASSSSTTDLVGASINLVDSSFSNNSSNNVGGAVTLWVRPNENGTLKHSITDSTFTGNSAKSSGGAVSVMAQSDFNGHDDEINLDSVTFTNNKTTDEAGKGGAIYAEAASVTIKGNSSFSGNSAFQGGAIYVGDNASLTLNASENEAITFSGNTLTQKDGKPITGSAGSDLYLGKANGAGPEGTAAIAAFTGLGTISFGGSIAGVEGSTITSSTANVSIADASEFLGSYELKEGTTKIAGAKYFGGTVTVNGGTLVTDDVVLVNDKTTVQDGAFKATSVTLGKAKAGSETADTNGKLINNGDSEIGTLAFATTGSSLEIGETGVLNLESVSYATGVDSVTVKNEGTINTSIANLITSETKDGKTTWTVTKLGKALADSDDTGSVNDTSYTGAFTAKQYTQLAQQIGNVNFRSATLVGEKDAAGKVAAATFEDAKLVGYAGNTDVVTNYGTAHPAVVAGDKDVTIKTLELVKKADATADAEDFHLNYTWASSGEYPAGTKTITIRGNGTEVFKGFTDKDGKALDIIANNTNFGEVAADGGTINNLVKFENGTNEIVGDFKFTNEKGIAISGTDTTLSVTGILTTALVNNTATTANGAFAVEGGVLNVLGTKLKADSEGKVADTNLQINAGNVAVEADEDENGGLVVAGDHLAAARAYKSENVDSNVLWIGEATTFTSNVRFTSNEPNDVIAVDIASVVNSGYKAAGEKNTVVNLVKFADNVSITGANELDLVNLKDINHNVLTVNKDTGLYEFHTGLTSGLSVDFGTEAYNGTMTNADGVVAFNVNENFIDDVYDAGLLVAGDIENSVRQVQFGQSIIGDKVLFGLDKLYENADKSAFETLKAQGVFNDNVTFEDFVDTDTDAEFVALLKEPEKTARDVLKYLNQMEENLDKTIVNAANTSVNMAVVGGAFTTALDINDQVTAAVSRRTSAQRVEGFTPWVDVFGTTNEAKRLYGNGAGYEADIYGAVLGFDYTAACGGTLGVAFNVGQADGNSVGSGAKVDNDADFYGFSLYGAQTFGDFNVKADLGYTQVSNDLSTNNILGSYKESLDANVFTFGLGTEYLAKFGTLNITPHAGIRLSRIDMDDSKYGADYDTMTVYQLPLGVAFSGNFDVNGWKLAPMVDLSVVPAFGDKDAVATYTGGIQSVTRVVDTNPIQATLGVSAQNGAWTFGLNYGLTAGSDDRLNNSFNANARYTF